MLQNDNFQLKLKLRIKCECHYFDKISICGIQKNIEWILIHIEIRGGKHYVYNLYKIL